MLFHNWTLNDQINPCLQLEKQFAIYRDVMASFSYRISAGMAFHGRRMYRYDSNAGRDWSS